MEVAKTVLYHLGVARSCPMAGMRIHNTEIMKRNNKIEMTQRYTRFGL
jgi:hypothetical protein